MSWPILWILSKKKTVGSRSKWNTSHIHFFNRKTVGEQTPAKNDGISKHDMNSKSKTTGLHTSFSLSRNFSTALASHSTSGWHQQFSTSIFYIPRGGSVLRKSMDSISCGGAHQWGCFFQNSEVPPKQTPIPIAHRFCEWSSFCTFHSCSTLTGNLTADMRKTGGLDFCQPWVQTVCVEDCCAQNHVSNLWQMCVFICGVPENAYV